MQITADHIEYAERLAKIRYRICPPTVSFEEVRAAAYEGLAQAARSFKEGAGAAFNTWAYHRVQGAISDTLRREDFPASWLHAEDDDLGVDRFAADDPALDDVVHELQVSSCIRAAVVCLPPRERDVILAIYFEGRRRRHLANDWNVGETRIGQIERRALKRLRERLSAQPSCPEQSSSA